MNKTFLALGVVGILTYSVPTLPVKAVSSQNIQTVSTDNQVRTAGLISYYSLDISADKKAIILNGSTRASISMKSIGYKDISIEYSSDGVHWYREMPSFDLLKSDSSSYYLNDYSISVNGGYYYRVNLKHYAKESGWFGSSQSVENTSNSVWVD